MAKGGIPPKLYKAESKELSARGWARELNRSTSMVRAHLKAADGDIVKALETIRAVKPKYSREQLEKAYELYHEGGRRPVKNGRTKGKYTDMQIQEMTGVHNRIVNYVGLGQF